MIDFSQKKFGLISLGCDKNRVDAEKLLARIKQAGYCVTENIEDVNILIINTCAFLQSSREEAVDTVLEFSEYKRGNLEKIVMTGCLPQRFISEFYDEFIEADAFLGTYDYDEFFNALEKCYGEGRCNYVAKGCDKSSYFGGRVLTTPCHYAYLKIADGCSNRCTYCLIPSIRGAYFSYPEEKLIEEAKNLGEVAELILVAQDITRYGIDLYGEKRLVKLIRSLSQLENIGSIRLLYAYPEMIDDELIAELRDNPKLIKYIDIPFQHSEDRVLKLMNRRGSREQYLSLLQKLKTEVKGIAVRSTFICGFPTETEDESRALGEFLKSAKLTNCGFFAYSREEGTPAYKLKGQVDEAQKLKRVEALYEVQKAISGEFLKTFVGKKIRVLCDGIDYERQCFKGRAYFNAPDIDGCVYFNATNAEQGMYYEVIVNRADSYDLYGQTEDYE